MCVKFQLSVSESSKDIKGIVLPADSVHLQAKEGQFDPDSASQRQFPLSSSSSYSFIYDVTERMPSQNEELNKP